MRIAIDAHALGGQGGGGATYIRNVVQALARIDTENNYTLLLTPQQMGLTLPGIERMDRRIVPPNYLPVRIALALPPVLLRSAYDLLHSEHMVPPVCPIPFVVSVHDISFEHYPEFFGRANVIKDRITMPLTVRKAAAVLTLSEYSKRDIVRRYCVPPEKVVVTGCAADPIFRPIHDQERLRTVRERYGTGERFILCVGELQPRKNLRTLISAYVQLRKADAVRHKLVLVGRKAWLYDDIFAAASASGHQDDLLFTGYVPDDDLVALYNAAEVFVYPSLFEGFGLPPLEAMACGTSVVTSNASSLPEVVGDAGLMVEPLDADAYAVAIMKIIGDRAFRNELSQRGLRRALHFSWETVAQIIAGTYHMVARSGRGHDSAGA